MGISTSGIGRSIRTTRKVDRAVIALELVSNASAPGSGGSRLSFRLASLLEGVEGFIGYTSCTIGTTVG